MTNIRNDEVNFDENDDFDQSKVSPEFLKLLEATVQSAGAYVIPSDNLRPHTLEAARDFSSDRKGTYALVKFALVIAILGCVSLPVIDRMASWHDRVSSPTSLQMLEIAQKKNVGIDWGLFEAFSELRQNQASRILKRK
jgi:hypothetical protein